MAVTIPGGCGTRSRPLGRAARRARGHRTGSGNRGTILLQVLLALNSRKLAQFADSNSFRQSHCELRPFVHFAGQSHFAAVGFDHGFDQTQSQAQAPLRTAFVAAIEARPDFVLPLGRDADAAIAENDNRLGWLGAGGASVLSAICLNPWNFSRWLLSSESACSSSNTT